MDGRSNRRNKAAFSNSSTAVWSEGKLKVKDKIKVLMVASSVFKRVCNVFFILGVFQAT